MKMQASTADGYGFTSPGGLSLLTFKVAGQMYGVPIQHVVRIIEMVTITALPGAPSSVQGLINFHGKAAVIVDLRHRFGLPSLAYGLHTPIILVHFDGEGHTLGLVVDSVDQVLAVPSDSLEMTETFAPVELTRPAARKVAHLAGVAKVDRRLILVLNVKALLTPQEQDQLSQVMMQQDNLDDASA